jgi:hypothetical protein
VLPALGQGDELLAAAGMQAETDGPFIEFRNRMVSRPRATIGRRSSRPVNGCVCEASVRVHSA